MIVWDSSRCVAFPCMNLYSAIAATSASRRPRPRRRTKGQYQQEEGLLRFGAADGGDSGAGAAVAKLKWSFVGPKINRLTV